jgi:hypothetical protein
MRREAQTLIAQIVATIIVAWLVSQIRGPNAKTVAHAANLILTPLIAKKLMEEGL